jgi:hypothetical protein
MEEGVVRGVPGPADGAGQLPRSSQNLPFSWRSLEYWWKNRLALDDPHNSYMYIIIYVIYIYIY